MTASKECLLRSSRFCPWRYLGNCWSSEGGVNYSG